MKIDRRKHYVMVLDTETANTIQYPDKSPDMSNVLVYDCGWAVVDLKGGIYETASYINRDIFVYERAMMESAYYANKISQYVDDIRNGSRIMASTFEIRKAMLDTIERWGIKEVVAHNAFFDYNALNNTQKWRSMSQYRYWFPYGITLWDTMRMAEDTICKQKTYLKWCQENGYTTAKGKPRKTAEILYRYITLDNDFEEAHTGLEDVLIEAQIMWKCFRQHKKMRKALFNEREPSPRPTAFQSALTASLREEPTLRNLV